MILHKPVANLLGRTVAGVQNRRKTQSSAEYCLNNVRQYDYENFISTLLLKDTSRSCALAIRGFNVEVARVAGQVTQETIGAMRLKFWQDLIDQCYTKDAKVVPKHPVAIEIYKALHKRQLTKRHFTNLIDVRRRNIALKGFKTLDDMEKYVEQSVSTVYYLVLEGCGVKNLQADHAASHLGKAQGIVQHLRTIPHARALQFIPIPSEILFSNGVSQEAVLRGTPSDGLTECVFQVAARAHQHLVKSRELMGGVPREGRGALLPAVPVLSYLEELQSVRYDVFHPRLARRNWKVLPQLLVNNLLNKY